MRALVIYDDTRKIWSIVYGVEKAPQGLQAMYVDIPDGAVLESIDTTVLEEPKPVFSYLPDSDIGRLRTEMEQVQKDIAGIKESVSSVSKTSITVNEAILMVAMNFTDAQALVVKEIYPKWSDLPDGIQLTKQDEAVRGIEITKVLGDDEKLYRVIQTHRKQSEWAPGQATASLFTVIDDEHAGTMEDPIPWAVNMIAYEGKYYCYNAVLYLCTRDSGIALQYAPDQLIDQYFSIVERGE